MEEPYRYIVLVIFTLLCQLGYVYLLQTAKNKADLAVKKKLTSIEDGIKTANALQLDRNKQIFNEEKDSIIVFFEKLNTWIWESLNIQIESYSHLDVDNIMNRLIEMQDASNKCNVAFSKVNLIIKDDKLITYGQEAINETNKLHKFRVSLLNELCTNLEIQSIINAQLMKIDYNENNPFGEDDILLINSQKKNKEKKEILSEYNALNPNIFNTAMDAVNTFKDLAHNYLIKENPTH